MEGLRSELRRLGMAQGQANRAMSMPTPKQEVITDPERQAKLAAIAQAYNQGKITMEQAAMLVRKV